MTDPRPFDTAAFKAQFRARARHYHIDPDTGATSYQVAAVKADMAIRQKQTAARARGHWWRGVDWLAWVDDPSTVSRPTERVALILLSREWQRGGVHQVEVERLIRADETGLTLREMHQRRGTRLEFFYKGQGRYHAVEVSIDKAA